MGLLQASGIRLNAVLGASERSHAHDRLPAAYAAGTLKNKAGFFAEACTRSPDSCQGMAGGGRRSFAVYKMLLLARELRSVDPDSPSFSYTRLPLLPACRGGHITLRISRKLACHPNLSASCLLNWRSVLEPAN